MVGGFAIVDVPSSFKVFLQHLNSVSPSNKYTILHIVLCLHDTEIIDSLQIFRVKWISFPSCLFQLSYRLTVVKEKHPLHLLASHAVS